MQQIHSWSTYEAVTLWWDQPDDAAANAVYTVTINEQSIETDRTHCICAMAPETSWQACVRMEGALLGEANGVTPRQSARVNVVDFGAVGDGKTLNTKALQQAIDACGSNEVYIPAGTFLTGGLRLHSDMSLYLDEGAVLQGTDDPADYLPKLHSRFEGIEQQCYQSLLNLGELDYTAGPNCRNVLIHGKGTISGGGQPLALNVIDVENRLQKEYLESLGDKIKECENDHTIPGRARGRLINLSNCEHVRITGLTLQHGASWNVHMIYSRDIVTDHCTFLSEKVWNGDGWDPDSSEDCTLFASQFYTGDDSVAIKSGKNPEGNVINRPTRRIRVFDCISHYGLGVAIGSEMSGGVEDVRIWHCDLRHSLSGVQIKGTKKRGGYVRNVRVQDCVLPRFLVCAVLYNDDGEGSPVPPAFSDMLCKRVHFTCWCKNYWEKDLHEMPCVDLAGFDVPGCEAQRITFDQCTSERDAVIQLHACRDIHLDIVKA